MKREINITARDSLVFQITEAMDDLTQRKHDIDAALDYLEQARNSSYTEPMNEVATLLNIAAKRLEPELEPHKTKATNLAGVAGEIYEGERNEG